MLKDLIINNRSCRRFKADFILKNEDLEEVIDTARLSASASNRQPLKYKIILNDIDKELIFNNVKWAGYLTDWKGPDKSERPSGYIVIVHDKTIDMKPEFLYSDMGLAAQLIMLALTEKKLAGCMLGSVNKENIKTGLNLSSQYEILLIIAAGKCGEKIVLEEALDPGNIKYYRDDKDIHHVPKRKLNDILI